MISIEVSTQRESFTILSSHFICKFPFHRVFLCFFFHSENLRLSSPVLWRSDAILGLEAVGDSFKSGSFQGVWSVPLEFSFGVVLRFEKLRIYFYFLNKFSSGEIINMAKGFRLTSDEKEALRSKFNTLLITDICSYMIFNHFKLGADQIWPKKCSD